VHLVDAVTCGVADVECIDGTLVELGDEPLNGRWACATTTWNSSWDRTNTSRRHRIHATESSSSPASIFDNVTPRVTEFLILFIRLLIMSDTPV
jgi:hypothetical protein